MCRSILLQVGYGYNLVGASELNRSGYITVCDPVNLEPEVANLQKHLLSSSALTGLAVTGLLGLLATHSVPGLGQTLL